MALFTRERNDNGSEPVEKVPFYKRGWFIFLVVLVAVGAVSQGVSALSYVFTLLGLAGVIVSFVWLLVQFARKQPRRHQALGLLVSVAVFLGGALMVPSSPTVDETGDANGETEAVEENGEKERPTPQELHRDTGSQETELTVDIAAVEAAMRTSVPQSFQDNQWFQLDVTESSDGVVRIYIQLDQGNDDDSAALELAASYYESAKAAAENAGSSLEAVDAMIVNGGAPVGLFSTLDGENYVIMKNGKRTEININTPAPLLETTPEPEAEPATVPEPEPTPEPEHEPPVETNTETTGQRNAVRSAKSYLDFSAFSHDGLVSQLEYEGYGHADAVYAAENCGADWNAQAVKSAKSYLDFSAFSYSGMIKQLEYEKFTTEQATYGADNCGADWNEQAAKSAESYLDLSAFSRDGLISQLEYEGFTHAQAVYGAEANGY